MGILGLGSEELLVILVIVLLLFGATAIPKLARSLGRAQGEFKRARQEFADEAAKAEAGVSTRPAPAADEESVRKSARALGIDDAGKDLAEVKRLVQQRLA